MEFHEKLQKLRSDEGLTQEELAEKLFVSRTAVSKWESGRGYPSIDSLIAIAKHFHVTIDELIGTEEIVALAEQELTGVGDFAQTVAMHLEDANLGGGAETVLQRTQHTEAVVSVTLELQYCVDDVFHHLGASEGAVFGDMADEQHRHAGGLGIMLELGCTLSYLTDAASRRVNGLTADGLDGVNDEHVGLHGVDMLEDALRGCLADNV